MLYYVWEAKLSLSRVAHGVMARSKSSFVWSTNLYVLSIDQIP